MSWEVLITCLIIIIARIADVALGTLRTVYTVRGKRFTSFVIGFVELVIWVVVVGKVISDVQENPLYVVSYALGFALGTFIGITVEDYLAVGDQVIRVFSRKGDAMADALRERDFGVTVFDGRGKNGPIQLLFIETSRRRAARVTARAREFDPGCFCVVDDIRFAGPLRPIMQPTTGWRSALKKK